jgi:hypothetical protein
MDENNVTRKSILFTRSTIRKVFWLVWSLLMVTGLLLILARTLALLGYEGQILNKISPNPTIALVSGMQLGQTFVAPRPELERIDVLMYGHRRHNTQPVTFHLRKQEADQDEVTLTLNASQVKGWRWQSFRFPPLSDSAGQAYYFFFDSATSTPDDALTLGGVEGDIYPDGTAVINGHPALADMAFRTYYSNVSLAEKLSTLATRITENKPSIWGDVRFYIFLSVAYVLISLLIFIKIIKLAQRE